MQAPDQKQFSKSYETILIVFVLAAALVYLRLPVFELFNTHLLGGDGGDSNLYFWLLNTFPKNLLEYGWFETNAFYPYKQTLAWSDNFLFPSLIYYSLRSLFNLQEITAWNIIFLSAQFINGLSVSLFAKRLGANFISCLILGLLFLSSLYFSEHLGHPQLQFFFFLPLTFWAFINLVTDNKKIYLFLFPLVLLLNFLSSVYFAISSCLICAIYFGLCLVSKQITIKSCLSKLLTSALFGLLIFLPFLLPYLSVKEFFGARKLHEFFYFGLSLSSFFSAAPISNFYNTTSSLAHSEAHFFWGIGSLALIIIAISGVWRISKLSVVFLILSLALADNYLSEFLPRALRLYLAASFAWLCLLRLLWKIRLVREPLLLFAATASIIVLIALGPLGYQEIGIRSFSPFSLFYKLLPGVDSMRAISRLGTVAIFLFGISSIQYLNRNRLLSILLLPILLIDSRITSFPFAPLSAPPKIFEEIPSLVTRNEAILIAPISGALDSNNQVISWSELASINSAYLVALRESAPLMINGYSGQRPKTIFELPRILSRFPSQPALDKLKEYKDLKYIVILGSKIEGFNLEQYLKKLSELGTQLKIVKQIDLDLIVEIHRNN